MCFPRSLRLVIPVFVWVNVAAIVFAQVIVKPLVSVMTLAKGVVLVVAVSNCHIFYLYPFNLVLLSVRMFLKYYKTSSSMLLWIIRENWKYLKLETPGCCLQVFTVPSYESVLLHNPESSLYTKQCWQTVLLFPNTLCLLFRLLLRSLLALASTTRQQTTLPPPVNRSWWELWLLVSLGSHLEAFLWFACLEAPIQI